MGHELGTIGEEATMAVMPALQGMITELRELIPIIGPQLKTAIESVDWKGLVTAVIDLTKFFVENATTIANSIIAVFALNTAFKAMQVAIGIGNVAIALKTWYVAQLTTGMNFATIAAGKLKVALSLIGVVAAVAAVVAEYARLKGVIDKSTSALSDFDTEVVAISGAAAKIDPVTGLWQKLMYAILGAVAAQKEFNGLPTIAPGRVSVLDDYNSGTNRRTPSASGLAPALATVANAGGGASKQVSALDQLLADANKNAKVTAKEAALVNKGLSADVAAWVTSTSKPIAAANQALKGLADKPKATVKKLTNAYNKSAAGQQAVAQAAQAAAESAAQAAQELAAAQAAAAAAEAAALAERERVYQSFADSVKNTFAGIKSSIMGAFDLTQLGGSTNAITRNMEKLLTRLRSFATNVKSLATMGLNPALLQQIISAGPMAGARLAESLAMGGASGLSAINAGYAEFGTLSGQIAQTGTESLFGTQAQTNQYVINVDGGVGSGATIGKAIVDAIKAYERTSGAVWQGA
jgi:hypothetical protein